MERLLAARVPPAVRQILDKCLSLSGRAVTREDGAVLLAQRDSGAVSAIVGVADELRRQQHGEKATYVVNRNIQFTNVCVKKCGFCAFSRTAVSKAGHDEGYFMPMAEIVRRATEAASMGATEICAQAGLPPGMAPTLYEDIARAIKDAVPDCHLHAFSPEEVLYGARLSRRTVPEMIQALREAGVDSLPGTSAEILDDTVRSRLAAARLSTKEWCDVIETAHEQGIPTTSTMMFGHVETPAHVAAHLDLLREVQARALLRGGPGRITEFVPLSFVAAESPLFRKGLLPGCRAGPSGVEVVLTHAVARIMLHGSIDHIQASWVKEGPRMAQVLLHAGVDDLGGTLINESISTAAGASHGQRLSPAELRHLIRGAGRTPVQRSTTYSRLKEFEASNTQDTSLIHAEDASEIEAWRGGDTRFGSYQQLTTSPVWRFRSEVPKPGRKQSGSFARTFTTFAAAAAQSGVKPDVAVVSYSPSFTVVPTFECFNSCSYCNFRARKGEPRAEWLTVEVADTRLQNLKDRSFDVDEILVLGGEVHPGSKRRAAWFDLTLRICERARAHGFLPHTNVGPLSRVEMAQLAQANASMGLMLEQISRRLYEDRRGPYARGAPSKDPNLRLAQLNLAGELRVPFTTGLLVGIGETEDETKATLDAIAESATRFGHIQECIVQPYRPGARDTWAPSAVYDLEALPGIVAMARERLPEEVVVQVPPNLVRERPDVLRGCLDAGARDLGGISPRDEVNPDYDFPTVDELTKQLAQWGYKLARRRAVHDRLESWAFAGAADPTLGVPKSCQQDVPGMMAHVSSKTRVGLTAALA